MSDAEIPRLVRSPLDDDVVPGAGVLVSRSLVYLAALAGLAFVLWASVAQLDVVVRAQGRLAVQGEPIALTPPEAGLVIEVAVAVGERVQAGDVLLRLEAMRFASEASRLELERAALEAEAARHDEAAAASRRALGLQRQELSNAREAVRITEEQVETLRELVQDAVAAPLQLQEKERELVDARSRVLALESAERRSRDEAVEREQLAAVSRTRGEALMSKLAEMRDSVGLMTLVAPVDGIVTDLAVKHPGSVVHTQVPAVILVPSDQPLMAELALPNESMRGVRVGATVRLRLPAYPYQDFGQVEGALVDVAPTPDQAGNYRAWATLATADRPNVLPLDALRPGLLVEADIVLDRRRVLDFALKPLKRLDDPITVEE